MNLKEKVQKLCSEHKKTLKEFEIESGVGLNQTAKWDKTSPSIDKIVKAANYFNVSLDYLCGLTDKKTPADGIDGLSDETLEIAALYEGLPPDGKAEMLNHLRAIHKMLKRTAPSGDG